MMSKWDKRYLAIAKEVSTWSKDPSSVVGAVLVDPVRNRIISTGYNGFPSAIKDDDRLTVREDKYPRVVHAEMNAILDAGNRAKGAVIYVYPGFAPLESGCPDICDNCCKHAIAAGVIGIVQYGTKETDMGRISRWLPSLEMAKDMWIEAGLFIRSYTEE